MTGLTIASMIWVLLCVVIGAVDDYTEGEGLITVLEILLPTALFLVVAIVLVKRLLQWCIQKPSFFNS